MTNGYNLTLNNLIRLKKCEVSNFQITIDGNKETHNQRRPLNGGYPTFDKIIENLVEIKDEIKNVVIRINIDKTNYEEIDDILKTFQEKDLTKSYFPYIARVENHNNCYDNDNCLSVGEFKDIESKFKKRMTNYGYDESIIYMDNYPKRINVYCGCDSYSSFVINADGEFYKCWSDIGKENVSIGNINNKENIIFNKSYLDYITFDPTLDIKCSACNYLPICMGGCAFRRTNKPNEVCEEIQYNFNAKLMDRAFKIKNIK